MKKRFAAVALAAVMLLGGCKSSGVKLSENRAVFQNEGFAVELPEDWVVYTGKDIYKEISEVSGEDAGELQKSDEKAGLRFLLLAKSPDETVTLNVTAQSLAVDSDGNEIAEPMSAELYARSAHDSALFDYFASGFRSGGDSVFEEETVGGAKGWHSYYEIYLPEEEGGGFLYGQSEHLFGVGDEVFSVQTAYVSQDSRQSAENVKIEALNG